MKPESSISQQMDALEHAKKAFLDEDFDPVLDFEVEELENRLANSLMGGPLSSFYDCGSGTGCGCDCSCGGTG